MELTNASGVGTLTVSGLFSNEVVTLEFDEEIRHTRKGDKTVLHFKNYTGSITLSRQPAVQERDFFRRHDQPVETSERLNS
jgi:hypothetical protein